MVIAIFEDRWDLVIEGEAFIKYEAKVSSRVSSGEWVVVDFGKLFTETSEQKVSLRGQSVLYLVQCKKICSHLGQKSIQSILKVIYTGVGVGRKERKELSVVCVELMV